jgi:hypothetical protein
MATTLAACGDAARAQDTAGDAPWVSRLEKRARILRADGSYAHVDGEATTLRQCKVGDAPACRAWGRTGRVRVGDVLGRTGHMYRVT